MSERRYTEEESVAIFRRAAQASLTPMEPPPASEGLTLADLQAIGGEVGMSPDAVARAAHAVEVRQGAVARRLLGLPIGVERQVVLRRRLTDEEWAQLVVQLREVFQARGKTSVDGPLRQWTNGNLYALLEPTPTGDRLRLGSFHSGAAASFRLGLVALAVAGIVTIGNLFGGHLIDPGGLAGLLVGGSLLVANGALRLPGWARIRGRQMEDVAARLALPRGRDAND